MSCNTYSLQWLLLPRALSSLFHHQISRFLDGPFVYAHAWSSAFSPFLYQFWNVTCYLQFTVFRHPICVQRPRIYGDIVGIFQRCLLTMIGPRDGEKCMTCRCSRLDTVPVQCWNRVFGSLGHRVIYLGRVGSGRVGSRVSVTDPVSDLVFVVFARAIQIWTVNKVSGEDFSYSSIISGIRKSFL